MRCLPWPTADAPSATWRSPSAAIRALIADDSPHARAFLAECEGDRVQGDADARADNRPVDADELQVASEQQLKLG